MADSTPAAFDLASVTVEASATVDILHPVTGEPTGITVTVAGKDSAHFRKAVRELQAERTSEAASQGPGKRAQKPSDADADSNGAQLLSRLTLSWGGVTEKGVPLAFSHEAAQRVYEQHRWLREQVDAAVFNRALFFKG